MTNTSPGFAGYHPGCPASLTVPRGVLLSTSIVRGFPSLVNNLDVENRPFRAILLARPIGDPAHFDNRGRIVYDESMMGTGSWGAPSTVIGDAMEILLPHISKWFRDKQEHFTTFARADTRIESWFKAELLVLFNRLVTEQVVESFKREASVYSPKDSKRKRVDFRLCIQGQEHLCELKALCISQATGTPRNLYFYFRDNHVGLIKDFKKLDGIGNPNKWVFAFVYPAPNLREWNTAIASLPSTLRHWRPITSIDDFPDWVYIALWKG